MILFHLNTQPERLSSKFPETHLYNSSQRSLRFGTLRLSYATPVHYTRSGSPYASPCLALSFAHGDSAVKGNFKDPTPLLRI